MGVHQEREARRRAEKRARLEAQVANGSLTIRWASDAERAAWALAAASRGPTRSNFGGPASTGAGAQLSQRTPNPNEGGGDD